MQGVQRFVVFAYLAISLVLWATLAKILSALAYVVNAPDASLIGDFTVTTLIAMLAAGAAGFYAFKNERIYTFSSEVVSELKKVTWPSKKETQTATVVVIVTTLIVAMILGVFDAAWGALTGIIYQ